MALIDNDESTADNNITVAASAANVFSSETLPCISGRLGLCVTIATRTQYERY